jgi:thiamine kinase-like enzyme
MLAQKGRAPQVFEMLIIHDEGFEEYRVAIKVEHIEFKRIPDGYNKSCPKARAHQKIDFHLRNNQTINFGDCHEGNLVFSEKKRRFVLIDFGYVYQKDHAGQMVTTPAAA